MCVKCKPLKVPLLAETLLEALLQQHSLLSLSLLTLFMGSYKCVELTQRRQEMFLFLPRKV